MIKSDVKSSFASSVRACRSRLGISQEELAGRAGLHRTYVSDIERGARNLSLESIEKLARALETSVSALFLAPGNSLGSLEGGELSGLRDELVDILFVEDNPDDVELTMRAFKRAKISNRVQVVHGGADALYLLFCAGANAHRRKTRHLTLIRCNLKLPSIDGLC